MWSRPQPICEQLSHRLACNSVHGHSTEVASRRPCQPASQPAAWFSVLAGGRGEGTEALASAPGMEEGKVVVEEGGWAKRWYSRTGRQARPRAPYARSGSSSQT